MDMQHLFFLQPLHPRLRGDDPFYKLVKPPLHQAGERPATCLWLLFKSAVAHGRCYSQVISGGSLGIKWHFSEKCPGPSKETKNELFMKRTPADH